MQTKITDFNFYKSASNLNKEIWLNVIGFENKYQVSNFGRVRSLWRKVNKTDSIIKKEIILKPLKTKSYLFVNLWLNGKNKQQYIHRLVATHFLQNTENKKEVNHIDGNKHNNKVNNLEWASPKENMHHAIKNKLINNSGESNVTSKLKEKDVLEIREMFKNGVSRKYISEKYKITYSYVFRIGKKLMWRHI